jgi:hypothetical protein
MRVDLAKGYETIRERHQSPVVSIDPVANRHVTPHSAGTGTCAACKLRSCIDGARFALFTISERGAWPWR